MKYVPPFGVSDAEAPYINGDPTIGRQGSIPPAAVFENPQREIISVISNSHIVPSDADLQQQARAIRSQRMNYHEAEQVANPNDIVISVDNPPLGAYTRGLIFRVRMRNTNTDACRLNAGPGWAPVRKMNGADVAPGELSNGAVITVVYDGAVWQLTNFTAAPAAVGEPIHLRIPYTVDTSPVPNTVIADFLPAVEPPDMVAGFMCAVKIANTNTGPTQMVINGMPPVSLRANGSSATPAALTLQGDMKRDDVIVFFYDGQYLWFAPNPEINAFVIYDIGTGGQFPTVNACLDEIRRKTIGANGYVDLILRQQRFGPITISHPGADRIRISGTLKSGLPGGPSVAWNSLARTGTSAVALSNDHSFNRTYLEARYGTIIDVPSTHPEIDPWSAEGGIIQEGPGTPVIRDILISGIRRQTTIAGWWQTGLLVATNLIIRNVAIVGCNTGVHCSGNGDFEYVTVAGCVNHAMHVGGSAKIFHSVVTGTGFSSPTLGWGLANPGNTYCYQFRTYSNSGWGISAYGGGICEMWACTGLGNGIWDLIAQAGGTVNSYSGYFPGEDANFGTHSPPVGTIGNERAIITHAYVQPTGWVPR
jgi:hypothetical protein